MVNRLSSILIYILALKTWNLHLIMKMKLILQELYENVEIIQIAAV